MCYLMAEGIAFEQGTAVFGHVPDRSSIQPRVSKNSVFILQSLVGLDGSTKMRSLHFYGFSTRGY